MSSFGWFELLAVLEVFHVARINEHYLSAVHRAKTDECPFLVVCFCHEFTLSVINRNANLSLIIKFPLVNSPLVVTETEYL